MPPILRPPTSPSPRTDSVKIRFLAWPVVLVLGLTAAACGGSSGGWPEGKGEQEKKGRELVMGAGCQSCHSPDGSKTAGPTWEGLAGSQVKLTNGETVTADAEYLAESINDPKAKVVDGYAPVMPSYEFTDEELASIVAYMQQLTESSEGAADAAWPTGETTEAAQGRELLLSNDCTSCHSPDDSPAAGGSLGGVAGSEVKLTDGSTVTADSAYLRESIIDPKAKIVEGYGPVMTTVELTDEGVDALVAYIEQLGS